MKLQLTFCLLLVGLTVAAIDKDYLDKSVLTLLKKNGGSFAADIECVKPNDKEVYHIEEKYSYADGVGEYVGQEKFKDDAKIRFTAKLIYLNKVDQLYQIDKTRRSCTIHKRDSLKEYFWTDRAPGIVYTDNKDYEILGPNALLEVLLEHSDEVECNESKLNEKANYQRCVLDIKKETLARLEYYFEDRDQNTMVPVKIIVHEKDDESQSWQTKVQINYFKFSTYFDKNQPIVSSNLPIGYGCSRIEDEKNKLPKIETHMGSNFELEFETVFTYHNTDKNGNFGPKSIGQLSDTLFDVMNDQPETGKEPTDKLKKSDFKTRIYYNKMYHNGDNSINVIETVNEFTNASTRIIYDTHTHVNYDVMMDEDRCASFYLTPAHEINYYYVQDLFINHPEFFFTQNEYEYLGNYKVRNIPCNVFEKRITDYNRETEPNSDVLNNELLKVFRKNVNGIKSDHAIVTHYYPIDKTFWGKDSAKLNVPMKIEIRLFSDDDHSVEIAKLTINVASFRPQKIDRFEIYDVSKCTEHSYDYNWFLVKFDDSSESVKKYARYEAQIKNSFKQLLEISPLRLGEVLVDSDENSLYVTTKLMELTQMRSYFHSKIGLTITEPTEDKFAENEELCARKCFTNKNCAAYSYCGALNCKLWAHEKFDEEFHPGRVDYDWKRIKTVLAADCTLNRRFVKFNEKAHQSNNEFLQGLDGMISTKQFPELIIVSDLAESEPFSASELKVNIQPGRHSKPSSKLNDEKLNDERAHIKYNDLFEITHSEKAFNLESINKDKSQLVASSRGLALWECQLTCINNDMCQSLSYCKETDECILTTLNETEKIDAETLNNGKCATSIKKYLARYHKHSKRQLTAETEDKITGNTLEEMNPNECAALCSNSDKCSSFDFCTGELVENDQTGFTCFLHQEHPNKDKKDKKDKQDEKWVPTAHCDHYTFKHTIEYNEFHAVKLDDDSEFIDQEDEISLDQCSALCTETETCNTFDHCIRKNKETKHIDQIKCRISKNTYSNSKVKEKEFDCATYSRINPRIWSKPGQPAQTNSPVHGGLVTFLSILSLIVGGVLGVGLAYYVIKNYISASNSY